jgi:outer membrane protein TolC
VKHRARGRCEKRHHLSWLQATALIGGAALCGCVHYAPAPQPPERVLSAFSARSLDDPQLRSALDAHLPSRQSEWPRRQWDRADLLFAMLYFNDSIAEGRAAVRVAAAAVRTAHERPNPTLILASEYANQHDGSPLWLGGATLDFPLDYGGRRSTRITSADLTAQQARYQFTELAWKTRIALRRALADMLISEREVALLQSVHADRESQLTMAHRQLELGATARGDVDRLVADALLDEQRLNDARRRASAARSAVAASVGIPVAALQSLQLTWDRLDDPPQLPEQLLQRAREDALLVRADVRSAVVGYSLAEEALRLEVSKQYPDVRVLPGYTWDHGVKRLQLGLALTLPLLNRNQGAIGEAQARRLEAGARLEATVATAYGEIDEGVRQWQLARERLTEAHGAIYDTAQRMYTETEQGFAAGGNDRTELVAARIARTLTELQVLDAARGAQEALAGLEEALRRPLEGPELDVGANAPPLPEGS